MTQINSEPAVLEQRSDRKNMDVETLNNRLAELTKEMNQFTYIVSHDLQSPLRMITGFLELLEKKYADKLDEDAKKYIDFTVKGAAKMRGLVFDLLEYSRLSSVVEEFTEVDLNVIMQEVKEKSLPAIEETGALITVSHLPVVMANKTQMTQLFQHLLENALKFRGTAPPEISISIKKEQDSWIIAFKDNGIGIAPAFGEKIFIVFRRLHNDEVRYPGTGIGLAICKKIVGLHGGAIWVESAEGTGSTFYFTLPATS